MSRVPIQASTILRNYLVERHQKDMEATKNAAEALDQVYPGWHDCVDIDTLDLGSITKCILAQVDRGKNRVWRRLWIGKGWSGVGDELGIEIFKEPGLFACNDPFRSLWIHEIQARRTPKIEPVTP